MNININDITTIYKELEKLATETVNKYTDNSDLTEKDKAFIISNMVTSLISISTQTVLQDKMDDAQVKHIEEEVNYTKKKIEALQEQLEDNRKIKVIDVLGSTLGTIGASGNTGSEAMWKYYFQKLHDLGKGELPTDFTLSKVT